MDIIPANSVTFEIAHIMAQRCACDGRYQIKSQQLLLLNDQPIDRIRAVCAQCGAERAFFFDVHTFYGQEDLTDRFEQTEARLREGIAAIHAQDWETAEAHLRRVVDAEEGEPAFGWGHYHLGMVLLVQGQLQEGLAHIQEALHWVPDEPEFERGAEKALMLMEQTLGQPSSSE